MDGVGFSGEPDTFVVNATARVSDGALDTKGLEVSWDSQGEYISRSDEPRRAPDRMSSDPGTRGELGARIDGVRHDAHTCILLAAADHLRRDPRRLPDDLPRVQPP